MALTSDERSRLLQISRIVITSAVRGDEMKEMIREDFPDVFNKKMATFVTITKHGQLRGCIGTVYAYQSLIDDVIKNAAASATRDYRFKPVSPEELGDIHIEISVLSELKEISCSDADELIAQIKPTRDGILIADGNDRATFLPQVWNKISSTSRFLENLCLKMGKDSSAWRTGNLTVYQYTVEEFHE